jgi:hypothetical protein
MAGIVVGAAAIAATASLAIGIAQNETQKKMNKAVISNMQEDSRLKLLSTTQRAALDYRVANAQNDTDKLAIYEQTLGTIGSSINISTGNIYAAGVASKSKQNYLQKSALIAGGFLLLGGAYYQLKKK